MRLLFKVALNALVLYGVTQYMPGFDLENTTHMGALALILAIANSIL